jgi:hypothetical protein
MSPTHIRDQHQPPITDQTQTPELPNSLNQADKYTTIYNILQARVTVLETIENPKLEDTPKDVISLIKLIPHKLTTTEHKQDTKTIENHLEHLNQKIDHLTKTLRPPNQNYNATIPQHRKHLLHTMHTTPRKQQNPPNP